jgi:hypothetical protein
LQSTGFYVPRLTIHLGLSMKCSPGQNFNVHVNPHKLTWRWDTIHFWVIFTMKMIKRDKKGWENVHKLQTYINVGKLFPVPSWKRPRRVPFKRNINFDYNYVSNMANMAKMLNIELHRFVCKMTQDVYHNMALFQPF